LYSHLNNARSRAKRIKDIALEIEELSEELNALLKIDENLETRSQLSSTDHDIELGNVVEITNKYKDLQGTRGTVIKVTNQQVTIRLENSNETIRRKKTNVKKI
jgi:hypothetical protein